MMNFTIDMNLRSVKVSCFTDISVFRITACKAETISQNNEFGAAELESLLV